MGSAPQEMKYTENCPACNVITVLLVLIKLGAGEVMLWLCPRAVQWRFEMLCSLEFFIFFDSMVLMLRLRILVQRQ